MPKTSSILSAVSIEHRLVTDRQRDTRHDQYRGCIASRGKNNKAENTADENATDGALIIVVMSKQLRILWVCTTFMISVKGIDFLVID